MAPKPNSASYLEPGSAVEVSADAGLLRGSWFSGTIITRLASDRFLVEYNHDHKVREYVSLHQLRPLLPAEIHRGYKSGDKVELFFNGGWWEGRVIDYLQSGMFKVCLRDSSESMVFSKKLLRPHRQWFNDNWVPIIKDNRDRISDLPDSVLVNIMNLMDTKPAIRTCVLSKRWKHLCKRIANLTFYSDFVIRRINQSFTLKTHESFRKFVSWVLSRDNSYSILKLAIKSYVEPEDLDRVITYALNHSVEQLTIHLDIEYDGSNFRSFPFIFCSQSLTSLKLFGGYMNWMEIPPNSLHLSALKCMHLEYVQFLISDNDYVEPFSKCHVLDTLVLDKFSIRNGEEKPINTHAFWISNHSLSSLRLNQGQGSKLVFSTPNLRSFVADNMFHHKLSITCNLSFIEQVSLAVGFDYIAKYSCSAFMSWLQLLANVKILAFSSCTIQMMLDDLSNPNSVKPQPPCFVRLETFKVKKDVNIDLSDEEVNRVVKYLLQNSPMARVDITRERFPNIILDNSYSWFHRIY